MVFFLDNRRYHEDKISKLVTGSLSHCLSVIVSVYDKNQWSVFLYIN